MACEQYRFLIQQQFDVELPPQDENQLSSHLSQCEACERFHFQMDQIIRTAADLDLPDETTPENLESLARIIIQQLPKPKGGPFAFITQLFAGKKQAKEAPKASHTPKSSSRFPHVRRNQSTTNQNVTVEDASHPVEDHSQSISTTLSGRFGRAVETPSEPEAPLTLADTIRRKVQEEKQHIPSPEVSQTPPETAWPSADTSIPPMPPSMPPGQEFSQTNFQEDNRYAPAGGAWEEPAWSQPPPVPTNIPNENPVPSPLSSIDLMGQTGDVQTNAWSSNSAPPPPPMPEAPNDLERGLWQAQQEQKAWSDEAEQIQTGFWQAFTPEQDSGLSGPGGQLPTQPMPAQQTPPPPPPLPNTMPPAPPPSPMSSAPPSPVPPSPMAAPVPPPPIPNAPQPASAPDAAINRFDIPIQERMAMNQSAQPQPEAPPPPPPIPQTIEPNNQPIESSSEPQSIISRLSSILGDAPAQNATPQLMSDEAAPQPQVPPPVPVAPIPSPAAPEAPIQQVSPPPAPVAVPASTSQPAPVQAQAAAPANPSGLFNVDESAIDKIFSENLGIVDAATAVNPGQASIAAPATPQPPVVQVPAPPPSPVVQQSAPAAPPPPVQPAQQAQASPTSEPKQSGLFADMDDAAIDQLFSNNLGISEQKAQGTASAPPIPQPIPAAPPLPPPVPQAPPQQIITQPTVPPPPQPAAPPPPPVPQQSIAEPIPVPAQAPVPPPPAPFEMPSQATPPVEQEQTAPQASAEPNPAQPNPISMPPAPTQRTQAPSTPAQTAPAQSEGMLNVTESDLDKLFSENLGVSESALSSAPKVNLTQAVETIRQATGSPQAPPKIEGVGRLSKNVDTTQDTTSGKISSIGKFLLDQKDLAKLGKVASSNLSSTDLRVLTMEAAQELQNLLGHIGSQPGVAGSVIVGHDGILIANNLPAGHDAESVGVWALGIFLNTENTIKMLGHNHVFQMVARTPQGFLVIADFGGGILVTVSQSSQTNELIPLMRTITQLVAQTAH